ncbi:MAG TPA: 1-phosphofructokinase family hexose kinase [Chloroflexota bacterium]|nr:1-phosphofructokinase family hexose kinase [Chloroflexota bacterium]
MILTVTLNPALDRTLAVPNFDIGFRHRATETVTLPGGKGINVARVVKGLGQPVIATGFVGGRTGERVLSDLEREDVLCDFVRIGGETRTSTAVLDPTAGTTTEVNEYGPQIQKHELELLFEKLDYLSRAASIVVLAGSIPRKVDTNIYAQLIGKVKRPDLTIIVDTYGEPLRHAVKSGPDLIFPNQFEAETLIGHEFGTEEEFISATAGLRKMGACSAVLHGRDLCVAQVAKNGQVTTLVTRPPAVDVVSTVGSGDSLVGGYAAYMVEGHPPVECLRFGMGCAVANTLSYGAGVFSAEEARRFAEIIEVKESMLA